jgi:hypothetical protein
VLVVGDSVAFSLAYHQPAPALRLRVGGEHILGCGVTEEPLSFPGGGVLERPHCVGFVASWSRLVRDTDPDVSLLVAGAWEVHDHLSGGRPAVMGSPTHDALVAAALRRALDTLTSGGRPVVVTDVPCFGTREPGDPRGEALRLFHLNELVGAVVAEYPSATMAPLAEQLCPHGQDAGGTAARYDGVHFTAQGAERLWPWLDEQLRRAAALARYSR